jgi:hypothetical protein
MITSLTACTVLAMLMLLTTLILGLKPKCTLFVNLLFELGDQHVEARIGIDEHANYEENKYYVLEVKDLDIDEDITGQIYIPDAILVDAIDTYAWELQNQEAMTEYQNKLLSHLRLDVDLVQK